MSTKRTAVKTEAEAGSGILITPPNMRIIGLTLRGNTHLAVNRFSNKARVTMQATQAAGSTSKSKRNRPAKDFEDLFEAAQYHSKEGWCGIYAGALRNAMISACKLVAFKMTIGKGSLFVEADGYDREDGTPLLQVHGSQPEMWIAAARNATGVIDLRSRPRWNPGEWELRPRVRFDGDQFTATDITNLVMRVGAQIGLCEGRPDSKNSAGIGYGLFDVDMGQVTLTPNREAA